MKTTIEPLPQSIQDFLGRYHTGSLPGDACAGCDSACCSQGGFALLENVELIYERYREGLLKRRDYEFKAGLSFGEFLFMYFDVRTYGIGMPPMQREMVFFHMRNLDARNNLISIPEGGSYWETRYRMFAADPKLNCGCVFLSEKVPAGGDGKSNRHCILHTPESTTHLSAKPIDCLLFTCVEKPGTYKKPVPEVTEQWFRLLAEHWPNGIERLKAMLVSPPGR